jgi:hypothetical protein
MRKIILTLTIILMVSTTVFGATHDFRNINFGDTKDQVLQTEGLNKVYEDETMLGFGQVKFMKENANVFYCFNSGNRVWLTAYSIPECKTNYTEKFYNIVQYYTKKYGRNPDNYEHGYAQWAGAEEIINSDKESDQLVKDQQLIYEARWDEDDTNRQRAIRLTGNGENNEILVVYYDKTYRDKATDDSEDEGEDYQEDGEVGEK